MRRRKLLIGWGLLVFCDIAFVGYFWIGHWPMALVAAAGVIASSLLVLRAVRGR